MRLVQALVAAGPHGDYASHLGIPYDRVFFGYDAVDNDYFTARAEHARRNASELRAVHRLPQRYLLASGRFIEKKNFPRLIEAFARALAADDRGHHLVILGDGPERPMIERAVERHGLKDRVHLPGFRSYEVLPHFYGLAEGFAHVALAARRLAALRGRDHSRAGRREWLPRRAARRGGNDARARRDDDSHR